MGEYVDAIKIPGNNWGVGQDPEEFSKKGLLIHLCTVDPTAVRFLLKENAPCLNNNNDDDIQEHTLRLRADPSENPLPRKYSPCVAFTARY